MLKPIAFNTQYVAFRHIPYLCEEQNGREKTSLGGGVLGRGETVWTKETYNSGRCPAVTSAFVDGVGIVSLDPRWLVHADTLYEQSPKPAHSNL